MLHSHALSSSLGATGGILAIGPFDDRTRAEFEFINAANRVNSDLRVDLVQFENGTFGVLLGGILASAAEFAEVEGKVPADLFARADSDEIDDLSGMVILDSRNEPRGTLEFLSLSPIQRAMMLGGSALGAFHGYRRTRSVGWAVGWAFLGGFSPVITTAVALAQGFGEPK